LEGRARAGRNYEIIGEFGTPGANSEWLEAEGKLAIRHVKKFCGDPPPDMELEIVWQEHELGNYPSIGLVWDDPMRGTPWNYIPRPLRVQRRCPQTLERID
jgi:hypothetical protein